MASTTINSSGVTFPDATVQATAYTGSTATVTSSGTDVTLTSSSNTVQQVSMTAANLKVILPNATTYGAGGIKFIINNNGTFSFDIAETGGGHLFTLASGQTTEIALSSIGTASGGWVATPNPSNAYTGLGIFDPNNITSTSATGVSANPNAQGNSSTMRCCLLSSSLIVVAYTAPTTFYPTVVAGTISGTTITWGTPVTANAVAAGMVLIGAVSATTAMLCYGPATTGGNVYARGITVSGTTVTASTQSSSFNTLGILGSICQTPFTGTTIGFTLISQAINQICQVLTHNGASAPTGGTQLNISATTGPSSFNFTPTLVCLSATSAVVCYTDTTNWYAKALTLSGTTFTAGSATTLTNFNASNVNGVAVSSTEALFYSDNGTQAKITVSGTSITGTVINNNNSTSSRGAIAKLSSTDYLASSFSGQQGVYRLAYNSTALTASKGSTITVNEGNGWDIVTLSSTQAIVCGTRSDGTNYPQAQIVAIN